MSDAKIEAMKNQANHKIADWLREALKVKEWNSIRALEFASELMLIDRPWIEEEAINRCSLSIAGFARSLREAMAGQEGVAETCETLDILERQLLKLPRLHAQEPGAMPGFAPLQAPAPEGNDK
jgi:hypothetical protein